MDNQNVSNNMTQQPVQYYGESDELLCGYRRFCMQYFILFVCITIFTALPCRYSQQVQLSTAHML